MAYKLLALDLDGTLVAHDGSITAEDRRALAILRRGGVAVTLATGRLYPGTRPVAATLGLDAPLVCADGASVVAFPGDDEIRHRPIVNDSASAVHRALDGRRMAIIGLTGESVLLDEGSKAFERYARSWSPNVEWTGRVLDHHSWRSERGLSGVAAVGDRGDIHAAEDELRSGGYVEVLRYDRPGSDNVSMLVLQALGVSKGSGLGYVAAHFDCSMEEVVAVGDWLNDVSMFDAAGRSFALAGSPPEVADRASDQLSTQRGAGGAAAEVARTVWGI